MGLSPLAGKPPEPSMLANILRLMTADYTRQPDPLVPEQRVAFGTSGHRGSAFASAFNEAHILAITQAICLYRQQDVPMLLGGDEFRRTQHGNNNAYCQDNETSWYDWRLLERNIEIFTFCRQMVALRRRFAELRADAFYADAQIRCSLAAAYGW